MFQIELTHGPAADDDLLAADRRPRTVSTAVTWPAPSLRMPHVTVTPPTISTPSASRLRRRGRACDAMLFA